MSLERFYSVGDVRRDVFPSRSPRWIKDTFRTGEFGPVLRDDGGWQISASALATYQARHTVGTSPSPAASALRERRMGNLRQFGKSSRP